LKECDDVATLARGARRHRSGSAAERQLRVDIAAERRRQVVVLGNATVSVACVNTYDEFGGVWDRVAPPKGYLLGPGTRIPTIVASPLARKSTVDTRRTTWRHCFASSLVVSGCRLCAVSPHATRRSLRTADRRWAT
jgi:hypothetical protein